MCDIGTVQVADRSFCEKGKRGGSAGGSGGGSNGSNGSANDSKDKEDCGVAQKCAEPETQRHNRCEWRDRSCSVEGVADGSFCEQENEVELLADPTDPLATRRTRKTVGWRRNAPSLRHRGATGAAGAAHATGDSISW